MECGKKQDFSARMGTSEQMLKEALSAAVSKGWLGYYGDNLADVTIFKIYCPSCSRTPFTRKPAVLEGQESLW